MGFNLDKLKPSKEDIIKRKLKHMDFCKLIVVLSLFFDKNEYIHTTDLKKHYKTSIQEARRKLEELIELGLLRRESVSGNLIEYYPVYNGEKRMIDNYFKEAGEKVKKEMKK